MKCTNKWEMLPQKPQWWSIWELTVLCSWFNIRNVEIGPRETAEVLYTNKFSNLHHSTVSSHHCQLNNFIQFQLDSYVLYKKSHIWPFSDEWWRYNAFLYQFIQTKTHWPNCIRVLTIIKMLALTIYFHAFLQSWIFSWVWNICIHSALLGGMCVHFTNNDQIGT